MATETKCSVDGCGKSILAKGYCRRHYGQIYRKGEIRPESEERQKAGEVNCQFAECEERSFSKGYCRKHYGLFWRKSRIRPEKAKRQMATEVKCTVAGCGKRMHAKGYCRQHYGQIWRKGDIYVAKVVEKPPPKNDSDRVRALERELERAEIMYQNVIGFEGRLKWRREIAALRKDWDRLGVAIPATTNSADAVS